MAEITVTGEVARVFYEGKGLSIVEKYQSRTGDTVSNYFTAWLDADRGIKEGQRLSIRGLPSAKIDEYVDPQGAQQTRAVIHINRVAILNTAEAKEPLITNADDLPF